jgi:hypothetical protein
MTPYNRIIIMSNPYEMDHLMHIFFYRSIAAERYCHLLTPFIILTGPLCWYPYTLHFRVTLAYVHITIF